MKENTPSCSTRGRPRAFDPDQALDAALKVFWKKGYEGASLTDLTEAMGINRPSMYSAFGNKETLFRKALARYAQGPAGHLDCALSAPTAREVAERLLQGSVNLLTNPDNPRGCLATQTALACGDEANVIREALIKQRLAQMDAVRDRFQRAIAERDLPATADAADLARYIATILQGMSVQAASGATRDELLRLVNTAMRAWPT